MRAKVKKTAKKVKTSSTTFSRKISLPIVSSVIILLTGLNLFVYLSPPKTIIVHAKDSTPLVQIYYLKNILKNNPTYRQGWITLAKLNYKLGNKEEAQYALRKAYEIDPNYKEIQTLQALLTK